MGKITVEEISWIRDRIEKTGKVAPIDVDKLMQRLVSVLNSKVEAKVLDESGQTALFDQYKAQERARLDTLHTNSVAEEKERLKSEFNAKLRELESRAARRLGQAEYAESVVESLEIVLGFILRAWYSGDRG